MQHHNSDTGSNVRHAILRQAIDDAMRSLGAPIHKTITWYMDSRGVFSDPKKIDINLFYSNLRLLLGSGADMIMEETWEHLHKRYSTGREYDEVKRSPLERIRKIMETGEA